MTTMNLSTSQQFTDSPIQGPEFLDAKGVESYFGLKKAILYRLLSENQIRAVSIRKRGHTRGKRLFDVASIRTLLNSNVDKDGES